MSALTNLFSAMAAKIRSKTGTQTTYTPAQMVSDGIDDVYAAGYDAGASGGGSGVPITPSNATPVSLEANEVYQPTANGYAISSYSEKSPTSTPSALDNGEFYKMTSGGYAINTYSSSGKTPAAKGVYFNSGWNRMTSDGYAYPSRATPYYLTGTDSATASSSSQPGTIFTYAPGVDGIYLIVVSAMTNTSNSDGYFKINTSAGEGAKQYIPTHGTGSSVNSVKSAYKVYNAYGSTGKEMSVQLGWDGSHSSCWFKYSINIFRIE